MPMPDFAPYMDMMAKYNSGAAADATARQALLEQQYRPFDPAVLSKALSDGGSLSQAPGFVNDAMWAMTPDTFQKSMASRVPITKQISDAVQLNDMVTGNSRNLANRTAINSAQMQAQMSMPAQALSAAHGQASLDQSANHFTRQLNQSAEQHAATLEEQKKQHAATYHLGLEHLKLQASQYKYMKDTANANATGSTPPAGTATDTGLLSEFDKNLKQFGAINKDGTSFNLGAVPDNNKKAALQAYMGREAARGLPYGQVYNVSPTHAKFLDNASSLILVNDGWHGLSVNSKGQQVVSDKPVVPFVQRAKPSTKQGSFGGAFSQQPAYGYTPE